jgi:hypothetical protein
MCMAVGAAGPATGTVQQPLAEVWSGGTWKVSQPVTAPKGGLLDAVSCASPTACIAVGNTYNKLVRPLPMAQAWDGTTWTAGLTSVACTSATACTAVGTSEESTSLSTLAEAWNGTSWARKLHPPPPA